MNVLAKTKKFFPGPIKDSDGRVKRHPLFQSFLCCWNTLLGSTNEQAFDDKLEEMRLKYSAQAMSYCEGTWLHLWKEKIVAYWVNQNYHFGVTVTSPIEGCYATLKSYLQRGNRDLRGVFTRLQLFWESQDQAVTAATAQQKLRPKTRVNIPLFAAVIQQVHGFVLEKILVEYAKLPAVGPPTPGCDCTIQQSLGLPCYYTIWERKSKGGVILLTDIYYHWYYSRPDFNTSDCPSASEVSRPVLNPICIKGKGRPRGVLGGVSRIPESSTRRNPSNFELPSSSAPPVLSRSDSSIGQLFVVNSGLKRPTSTSLAMARLADGYVDQYEAGTQRERGYMRGISSIYRDDSLDDTAMVIEKIQQEVIGGIEVYTQDGDFELDKEFV